MVAAGRLALAAFLLLVSYGDGRVATTSSSSSALVASSSAYHRADHDRFLYWSIRVDSYDAARLVARRLDVELVGRVGTLDQYFLVRASKPVSTSVALQQTTGNAQAQLHGEEDFLFDSLDAHKLSKRADQLSETDWDANQHHRTKLYRRAIEENMNIHDAVMAFERQLPERRLFKRTAYSSQEMSVHQKTLGINDPGFQEQWHLYNREKPTNDLNVTGVWLLGIKGNSITVALVDDGLDYTSKELKDAFEPRGSYDFNDHDPLPRPRLYDDYHGTRCAGEIAARKGNNICGIGVAYESKVAGIRILSGELTRSDEAAAYIHALDVNDIYSCSFGPADDGKTVDGPSDIVQAAFEKGISQGRKGLGALYVFASGNGGRHLDNCNSDGYANSIYTITVGAADRYDKKPWYSEVCAAQLAVTYSGGTGTGGIFTSDVGESLCTNSHSGTSAAAPLAAGILALVLSARPDLSWRDVQRLVIENALPFGLDGHTVLPGSDHVTSTSWTKLPSGRYFSHAFGYGIMDAYAIVNAAKQYKLPEAGPQNNGTGHTLQAHWQSTWLNIDKSLPLLSESLDTSIEVQANDSISIARLEHVSVIVSIESPRRGNIIVNLISPANVLSMLATQRPGDLSDLGYQQWTFTSVQHWDENPVGNWTLSVRNVDDQPNTISKMVGWSLTLFGEQHVEAPHAPPPTITITNSPMSPVPTEKSPVVTKPIEEIPDTLSSPSPNNTTPIAIKPQPKYSNTLTAMAYITVFGLTIAGAIFAYRRHRRRASRYNSIGPMSGDNNAGTGSGWKLHTSRSRGSRIRRLFRSLPFSSFRSTKRENRVNPSVTSSTYSNPRNSGGRFGLGNLPEEQVNEVMGTFLEGDDNDEFEDDGLSNAEDLTHIRGRSSPSNYYIPSRGRRSGSRGSNRTTRQNRYSHSRSRSQGFNRTSSRDSNSRDQTPLGHHQTDVEMASVPRSTTPRTP